MWTENIPLILRRCSTGTPSGPHFQDPRAARRRLRTSEISDKMTGLPRKSLRTSRFSLVNRSEAIRPRMVHVRLLRFSWSGREMSTSKAWTASRNFWRASNFFLRSSPWAVEEIPKMVSRYLSSKPTLTCAGSKALFSHSCLDLSLAELPTSSNSSPSPISASSLLVAVLSWSPESHSVTNCP